MEKNSNSKVWLITGAGRGIGLGIAKAALAAGHQVVATGRKPEKVSEAIGKSENLLVVKLDVTSTKDAETAVKSAIDRFGKIDVLVNNAGNFYAGFFEELSLEQIQSQINTNANLRPFWESMNGKQGGDPEKLAKALLTIADQPEPPQRWFAGADAVAEGERKANELMSQTGRIASFPAPWLLMTQPYLHNCYRSLQLRTSRYWE